MNNKGTFFFSWSKDKGLILWPHYISLLQTVTHLSVTSVEVFTTIHACISRLSLIFIQLLQTQSSPPHPADAHGRPTSTRLQCGLEMKEAVSPCELHKYTTTLQSAASLSSSVDTLKSLCRKCITNIITVISRPSMGPRTKYDCVSLSVFVCFLLLVPVSISLPVHVCPAGCG